MAENQSVDARLLAERLRRFVEAAPLPDASAPGRVAGGGSSGPDAHPAHTAGRTQLLRPRETVDLSVAWSAVETVRAEIDAEEAEPAFRGFRHSCLDRAALELARAAVGQAVESNRQFIEDVSHDVRSPLNSILLLAEALLGGPPGSLGDVQRHQASVVYSATVALVRLVNDVIDASRLGSGLQRPVERTPFSASEVLREVGSLVSPLAEHRSVELVLSSRAAGRRVGDRQLLCRVLINLVSNAIDAAGPEGRVEVTLDGSEQGWLGAAIIDTGGEVDLGPLQELLVEGSGSYPRYKDGWTRGLGLTVSGRLIRAANGELSVERLEDGRTCFNVHLPFEAA